MTTDLHQGFKSAYFILTEQIQALIFTQLKLYKFLFQASCLAQIFGKHLTPTLHNSPPAVILNVS